MQIEKYYPEEIPSEIQSMLTLAGTQPSLKTMWALMDLAWFATKADSRDPQCIDNFYAHPVWTLNGIFTETHVDSVHNREIFSTYIASKSPKRIADYGGGFGALARMLAKKLPDARIEIVEPYPSPLALHLTQQYGNIAYVDCLTGEYDCVVALDVLEHVPNPLDFAHTLARHTLDQGFMLLASCFYPVIQCHLTENFYLRHTFDFLLRKIGIEANEEVLYGTVYTKGGCLRPTSSVKKWILFARLYYEARQVLSVGKRAIRNCISVIKSYIQN